MNDVRNKIVDHLPALQRYALSLAYDPTAAQDLVQECAVRALSNSNLYKSGTNLRAWLFTILHNLHISEARRSAKYPAVKDPDAVLERLSVPPAQIAKVMLNDVDNAMSRLPTKQRRILMSIGVEGKSYGEMSDEYGVPVGTIKSRYARARTALAEKLQPRQHKTPAAAWAGT